MGQAPPSGGNPQLLPNELLPCYPSFMQTVQKITIYTWGIPQEQFAPPETRRPVIPACIPWVSAPASPSAKMSTDLPAAVLYPASGAPRDLLPFLFTASVTNDSEFLAAAKNTGPAIICCNDEKYELLEEGKKSHMEAGGNKQRD